MPIIETKGGPTPLGADSTAGQRGIPARRAQDGGANRLPSDGSDRPAYPADLSLLGTDDRGGNVRPARQTPTTGDGTGQ